MTDRIIVTPGQIPLAEDQLHAQRFMMIALGMLMSATHGQRTTVSGIDASPTLPASMSLQLAPGSIMQPSVVDASSYGILPADLSSLMKMGTYPGARIPLTAPAQLGTSLVYLVQASLVETDEDPQVLDYYNAANPEQPWSGPENSGAAQFTKRVQRCAIQIVAGAPAATGTQVAPAASVGWTPLWLVTVSNGQTAILAEHIQRHPQSGQLPYRMWDFATWARVDDVFNALTYRLNSDRKVLIQEHYPNNSEQMQYTRQWVVPDHVYAVKASVVGGGGGGSGTGSLLESGQYIGGGGGGAGGRVEGVMRVQPGMVLTLVTGRGGDGGAHLAGGADGGDTGVYGSLDGDIIAHAGQGGGISFGGIGGGATNFDGPIAIFGGDGGDGGLDGMNGGDGGSSSWGGGGRAGRGEGGGGWGRATGSGGGGAYGIAGSGGRGAPGLITLEY
ncbi:hypothetical protein CR162_21295 [Pseudoroseomonas rhizosphaerae]|uniref:Uncharacterized protein n=1 Tax=Teichococcus rhizosphaerae TaxID=1335062 RepID=A0A2C7A6J3_9PROT|nr:hypothetical protein [Pseudoroseomonas rhizosphaerae]PHK92935.1 hypothetical protein CR162_21295 [Pseudoroseomonas rhizosphaerae]